MPPTNGSLCPVSFPYARNEAHHLSTENGYNSSLAIWSYVQRGLVYPAPHAIFLLCWKTSDVLTYDVLCTLVGVVRNYIHDNFGNRNTTVIAAVGFNLWQEWCNDPQNNLCVPNGMRFTTSSASIAADSRGVFADSQGDLLFHIKSDDAAHCRGVKTFIVDRLEKELQCVKSNIQETSTKSTKPDKLGGKVLGCRFSENLNNPSDPVTVQQHTIIGFEDPAHLGGSFIMVQKFKVIWENLLQMNDIEFQNLVGRDYNDVLIPNNDTRSHIKSSRVQDSNGNTTMVLRLGLPFGSATTIDRIDGKKKGASLRDEEGIYFAALAKSALVLEAVMKNQIGDDPKMSMRDRLLSNMRSDLGGFFYIPNMVELKQEAKIQFSRIKELSSRWTRFPGVDWTRLDRHYNIRSQNGYMYYNHQDYLFTMSTMAGDDCHKYLPPSNRVLSLLANVFSRWQDTWYVDRAQMELKHLHNYMSVYFGKETADATMELSIPERMGWAIRMAVGYVFTSHKYGFRGQRKTASGDIVNGTDTYRIHPAELIVGALPNLGLGQGRYVIDYMRPNEQLKGFFTGITFASGVGHVVPDFKLALEKGLSGMIGILDEKLQKITSTTKQQFYKGVKLALIGVQEYSRAYANLALEIANSLCPGQLAESANLRAIAERMEYLAHGPPRTMLEAAQLIFTLHACLHLTGEPTAIGRLDQLLYPFYENDVNNGTLDMDTAQEIIDCFWVKVGEKVQMNRFFVEDHQPYGNLAMGGSSGNYPQGGANNQWIQQVTVGGTIAERESPGDGLPAYNDITLFCLRAARRLPLNAPCLSLRMRKDIPDKYVEEAALAILSGGAHPIFINDHKIIPGLIACGDMIGQGKEETVYTPVELKAAGRWKSTVDLATARDYACDGCYEPQLSGCNWFTLGGFVALTPLEAALNQGKAWLTAGPVYFRGQRVSMTTKPATEIASFNELLDLYFTHVKWMYSKEVDSLLAAFGNMADMCPSPLLSMLTNDCIEKGLDIYGGGARYNLIAPCFTGLPNTINSLYAIKKLVFDPENAMTSLAELVQALLCNWGESMQEPFVSTVAGSTRIAAQAERYRNLRQMALSLPRYGRGINEIDDFGNQIIQTLTNVVVEVFIDPVQSTAKTMVELAQRFGTPEMPFGGFQVQPGAGTFENYVEFGSGCGASADGRLSGHPLSSDISPTPSPADKPIQSQAAPMRRVLAGYTGKGTNSLWSGAPTDLNIDEEFPAEELQAVLRGFANGSGSNLLTITCANPETMAAATESPEKYNLLRMRMGGWSEFFIAMFPAHQQQHQRRPRDTPCITASANAASNKRIKLASD